jgi:serine/threonine protein kinase
MFRFPVQSAVFDSQPKSTVGTPAYIAPEVLQNKLQQTGLQNTLLTLMQRHKCHWCQ